MNTAIYTIGYGNRIIEDFINLLHRNKIDYLIDIRTNPFSRFNPNFRRKSLELHLINNEIRYLFFGSELGGKPKDQSCYTNEKVDYEKIKVKPFFKSGIDELLKLVESGNTVALMCAEQSPVHCHRKLLVGEHLESLGYSVIHIDKYGAIFNQLF